MESLNFRKSSYSSNNGGACIETASTERLVLVRDSKDQTGPRVTVSPEAWKSFTRRLRTS